MSATTYILSSATYKGTSITDLKSFGIQFVASVSTLSTDGSRNANLKFMDNKSINVAIETSNQSLLSVANLAHGGDGQLVLVAVLRGSATSVGASITMTIPQAVLTNISETIPSEGSGSAIFSFECYDSANDGLITFS
jgi:hypothetical protein